MIFRIFLKVARLMIIAMIAALLLFCTLFAILQSKWAKMQIKEKVASYLKNAGIAAQIVDLEGQPPFSWRVREADLQLNENSQLKLSNIKFRIAILPLLKGRVTINYLKIQNAEYRFQLPTDPGRPLTMSEAKILLQEKLEKTSLPFSIALNHFAIERLSLINYQNGKDPKEQTGVCPQL
jgi:autotransporter translocation and assembly factor TamB